MYRQYLLIVEHVIVKRASKRKYFNYLMHVLKAGLIVNLSPFPPFPFTIGIQGVPKLSLD